MAKKHKVKNGIVVMLDVLGARSFSSRASLQFLKTRKAFLDKLQGKISLISQATIGMELDPPEIVTFQDSLVLTWDLIGLKVITGHVFSSVRSGIFVVRRFH